MGGELLAQAAGEHAGDVAEDEGAHERDLRSDPLISSGLRRRCGLVERSERGNAR